MARDKVREDESFIHNRFGSCGGTNRNRRFQWRVSYWGRIDDVLAREDSEKGGVAVKLPVMFPDQIEKISKEDLARLYFKLQATCLSMEQQLEIQEKHLEILKTILTMLGYMEEEE